MSQSSVIDKLIAEYLLIRGYDETFRVFERERQEDKAYDLQVTKIVDCIFQRIYNFQLVQLQAFWKTLEERLFVWVKRPSLNETIQYLWSSLKKLFLLNAVKCKNLAAIQLFFKTFANDFDDSEAIWFSLPYVNNPEHHRDFELFYTAKWREALRLSLENLMEQCINEERPKPLLESFEDWQRERISSKDQIKCLREQLEDSNKALRSLQITYREFLESAPCAQPEPHQAKPESSSRNTGDLSPSLISASRKRNADPPPSPLLYSTMSLARQQSKPPIEWDKADLVEPDLKVESKDACDEILSPKLSPALGVPAFRTCVTIVEKDTPKLVVFSEGLDRLAYSLKGKICIWSLESDQLEKEYELQLRATTGVVALSFIYGNRLVIGCRGLVEVWRVEKKHREPQLESEIILSSVHPLLKTLSLRTQDSKMPYDLVLSCYREKDNKPRPNPKKKRRDSIASGKGILLRYANDKQIFKSKTIKSVITGICRNHNGRIICCVCENGGVWLFSEELQVIQEWYPTKNGPLLDIQMLKDFSCLVLAENGQIGHINLNSKEKNQVPVKQWISTVDIKPYVSKHFSFPRIFSLDGHLSFFLTGGVQQSSSHTYKYGLHLYNYNSGKLVKTIGSFPKPVSDICWCGNRVAITTQSNSIVVYSVI